MKLDYNKIKKYLESNKYDFKLFKILYTSTEILNINNFKLDNKINIDFCGNLENLQIESLNKIGNNCIKEVNKMEKLIIKIIKNVLLAYQVDYFWLSIRVTQQNNNYDISRWHKDSLFFPNDNKQLNSKFITILKGPGTLFIRGTKKVNNIYNELKKKKNDELKKKQTDDYKLTDKKNDELIIKYRPIIAKALDNQTIIQIKNNQGAILFAGKESDKCALHSEPPNNEPRLFISILPGSKINIMELKKRFMI